MPLLWIKHDSITTSVCRSTLEVRCPMVHPLTSTMLSDVLLPRVGHATRTILGHVMSACIPGETRCPDTVFAYCRG